MKDFYKKNLVKKMNKKKKSAESREVECIFRATTKGYGFAQILDEDGNVAEEIFIPACDKKGAYDKDKVIVRITKESAEGMKAEGEIVKIVTRGTEGIVGTFRKSGKYGFVTPDDKKFEDDIYISREHTKGAEDNYKVYVHITNFGSGNKGPEGRITEILGDADDARTDYNTVLKEFDIYPEFPMEVRLQADEIPQEVPEDEKKGRLDLRNELTVTIDGADAKDLDDAVTLKTTENGYELGVHIADVSHYVRENTPLDTSALSRGTSVYLINKVVPMLPKSLSNGICSLNARVDRLALSCIMDIDRQGHIVGHKIAETVINVNRRMTYDEVSDIIKDPENNRAEYGELTDMFVLMDKVSGLLRENRKTRGAIDFDFTESKVILNDEDFPVEIVPEERGAASKIIEDFMLAANETVAEDYFWQDIPFLFRAHEKPDDEKITKLFIFVKNFGLNIRFNKNELHPKEIQTLLERIKGMYEEPLISRLTLRSLKQARYMTECVGHFGLATKYYCHFTSPIRRYPDLQIHRIIKETLHGKLTDARKAHYASILDDVATKTSALERNAEEAEREIVKLKHIEYMGEHLGEAYEGVISGLTGWGIYVELPNSVEGMIALKNLTDDYYTFDAENYILVGEKKHKTYKLGEKLYIQVADTDKLLKTIDFKIIGKKKYDELTKQRTE